MIVFLPLCSRQLTFTTIVSKRWSSSATERFLLSTRQQKSGCVVLECFCQGNHGNGSRRATTGGISSGIPQGAVLGPPLRLVFSNPGEGKLSDPGATMGSNI